MLNNKLKNQTILITGGAGFIGSHLVDQLLQDKYDVVVLDDLSNGKKENLSNAFKQNNFKFIEGSILNTEDCEKAIQGVDYVFHLACLGVRHSIHSPFENHLVNAEGTLNVLLAARKENVKQFFYISTSEIYGRTTIYGASKLAGEHYTNSFFECYGLNTTVLRIFNNYGPRAHYEGDSGEIIPRVIVSVLNDIEPIIFGDGSITRDFFFVKDTAKVLSSLIGNKKVIGKTFNLGTGKEISMKNLVEEILTLLPDKNLNIRYLDDRPADVPRLWVDSSKIRSEVKIDCELNFRDGLIETINYYRSKNSDKNLFKEITILNWKK